MVSKAYALNRLRLLSVSTSPLPAQTLILPFCSRAFDLPCFPYIFKFVFITLTQTNPMYLWLKRYFSFTSYHAIKNQDDYLSRLSSEDGDYEEMKEETKQRSTKTLWRILLVLSLLVFASALFDQSTRFRLLSACQNSCAEELRVSSSNKKALDPVGMSKSTNRFHGVS